ncbi:MAG: 2-C-methyl-D-erythritol 4-phosphate cytidylyltransferase [Desulfobacterales bacterium]|jgi:2-C-methyl-D-erythritol 4-phosphate cytidylyltransferase|nr:2-C-methyl-D-erythritol 4-phosphate cytidylyltransferase [Desulfobacterales bacterium]
MNSAVIVAAGQGLRMGGLVRKQFLQLDGLPILSHTLRVFNQSRETDHIVLVIPESDFDFCRQVVLPPVSPKKPITLVPGGKVRQESVYNGLRTINDPTGLVAIHDGVRPFITTAQLSACYKAARNHHGCILGIPASDTLKVISENGGIIRTVDRANVWLAQTPQVFRYDLIRHAHEQALASGILGTDDAVLLEKTGHRIKMILGSRNNIKITTPEDLLLAEALLQLMRQNESR